MSSKLSDMLAAGAQWAGGESVSVISLVRLSSLQMDHNKGIRIFQIKSEIASYIFTLYKIEANRMQFTFFSKFLYFKLATAN